MKRHARTIAASLVLLVAFGWVLSAGGLPLFPPEGSLGRLHLADFMGFVVGMVVHMVTRLGRCHFLIAPIARLPLRRILTINAIALALITFLPLRLGEVARPAMLREKGHLSAWAVTGTVGAERILDGLVFSVMLLAGLALAVPHEPIPTHVGGLPVPASLVPQAARIAGVVFGAAFLVMAAFYWYRALARRVTERLVGIVSKELGRKIADVVERLSEGLRFLVNPRYTVPYLGVTAISIGSQIWSIDLLASAVGIPELTFAQASVVLGVVALGFGLPNAPGFFGTVQLALYAGLSTYIAPEKVAREGAALVFLFYVVYLGLIVLQAALALVVEYALPMTAQRDDAGGVQVQSETPYRTMQ